MGDFGQLGPVGDSSLFSPHTPPDSLVSSFSRRLMLRETHRQAGDAAFADLLSRLHRGRINYEDYGLLLSRRQSVLSREEVAAFDGALIACYSNATADAYNAEYLRRREDFPVVRLMAEDRVDVFRGRGPPANWRASVRESDCSLARVLLLQVGAPVMLRTNLSVRHGLVTGTLGTVVQVVYGEGAIPGTDLPLYVMVDVPSYTGPLPLAQVGGGALAGEPLGAPLPFYGRTVVPVAPVTFKVQTYGQAIGYAVWRRQVPLLLAAATTVHKVQGLTLPRLVLDLSSAGGGGGSNWRVGDGGDEGGGGREEDGGLRGEGVVGGGGGGQMCAGRVVGLAYVAVSRVRRLSDLLIVGTPPMSLFLRAPSNLETVLSTFD